MTDDIDEYLENYLMANDSTKSAWEMGKERLPSVSSPTSKVNEVNQYFVLTLPKAKLELLTQAEVESPEAEVELPKGEVDSSPISSWSEVIQYWEKQGMGSIPVSARPQSTRPQRPRPSPTLIRGAKDAERVARDWMVYMGFDDAILTKDGPDGGVDVRAARAVAQVKAEMKPIGRPPIQSLCGIAAVEGRKALFFSLAGYTSEAKDWADQASVALFVFNLAGEVEGANDRGAVLLASAGR